jgi:hypothetical protein
MPSIATPWGYSVESSNDDIPPILTTADFATLTGNRFSSSAERVQLAIDGVTAAARNWCGWHIAPSLACGWIGDGAWDQVVLPCMAVSSVASVTVAGQVVDASMYEWRSSGLVRFPRLVLPDVWRSVDIAFTAGYGQASDIANVICQIVANDLVAAPGISSEQAGQVRATYNQTASGVAGGITLLERDKELLAPYRLPRM